MHKEQYKDKFRSEIVKLLKNNFLAVTKDKLDDFCKSLHQASPNNERLKIIFEELKIDFNFDGIIKLLTIHFNTTLPQTKEFKISSEVINKNDMQDIHYKIKIEISNKVHVLNEPCIKTFEFSYFPYYDIMKQPLDFSLFFANYIVNSEDICN